MFIICSIFVSYELLKAMSHFPLSIELKLTPRNQQMSISESEIHHEEFSLNTQEIKNFHNSIKRIHVLNNRLIEHIENFETLNNNGDFSMSSATSIRKFVDIIHETRKNSEKCLVCEYEFVKFCEYFYQTLHYIMKNEEELQNNFFEICKDFILPILKKIKLKCTSRIISHVIDLIQLKICTKKISDERRLNSLSFFLYEFIGNQNETITMKIDKKQSLDDILALSFNVFCIFYLRAPNKTDFHKKFISEKYCISLYMFENFLFINGLLSKLTFDARIELGNFLQKKKLNLETQFVKENLIPPICDIMNKHLVNLGLEPIEIMKND